MKTKLTTAAIRKRYVRTRKMGDSWSTYLQVDHQGFLIVENSSRSRAQWFGKMLAIALARLIETERK